MIHYNIPLLSNILEIITTWGFEVHFDGAVRIDDHRMGHMRLSVLGRNFLNLAQKQHLSSQNAIPNINS